MIMLAIFLLVVSIIFFFGWLFTDDVYPLALSALFFIASIIVFIVSDLEDGGTFYECPCEVEDLIEESIIHHNKTTGDTTTTTYLDLTNCIKVNK